jgi:hypothetical protein
MISNYISEFEKYWERRIDLHAYDKETIRSIWIHGQVAALRILQYPPYIPKVGETIITHSLIHPRLIGLETEVTDISERTIKTHDITIRYLCPKRKEYCVTDGFLGEVSVSNADGLKKRINCNAR